MLKTILITRPRGLEILSTGEFTPTTVGDGVFTLTELEEKYSDENGGIYSLAQC